jgi:hypothetical protein
LHLRCGTTHLIVAPPIGANGASRQKVLSRPPRWEKSYGCALPARTRTRLHGMKWSGCLLRELREQTILLGNCKLYLNLSALPTSVCTSVRYMYSRVIPAAHRSTNPLSRMGSVAAYHMYVHLLHLLSQTKRQKATSGVCLKDWAAASS